jgi:large subunit ribosomal protein L29e
MAKSKNHTNHNQSRKAHRNGIKRPQTNRTRSSKGVDPKFRKNALYALNGSRKAHAGKKESSS